jgi:hypothetical protein
MKIRSWSSIACALRTRWLECVGVCIYLPVVNVSYFNLPSVVLVPRFIELFVMPFCFNMPIIYFFITLVLDFNSDDTT